ncbi:MAG TPA: FtsX-like permease family protein, partial [Gemmatimonadaceae bacterium]
NYLSVAGMPLLAGRLPNAPPGDAANLAGPQPGQPVVPREVAVDRALAHALWPDGNAIGQRMYGMSPRGNGRDADVVVGVVEGAHIPSLAGPTEPEFYQPTIVPGNVSYLVRVTGDAHVIAPELRKLISETNSAAVARATTIGDDYIRDALAPSTFAMALLGTFALIALVLSAVGLYGMIAYSVSQRTREIGIRMALGADSKTIAALVIGDGVRLAVFGVVLGAAGAFAATRVLNGMLYDVAPGDPMTFATISVLVVGIALAASYVPARRAVGVDPTEALRGE